MGPPWGRGGHCQRTAFSVRGIWVASDRCQGLCPAQADKVGRNTAARAGAEGWSLGAPQPSPREKDACCSVKPQSLPLAGPRLGRERRGDLTSDPKEGAGMMPAPRAVSLQRIQEILEGAVGGERQRGLRKTAAERTSFTPRSSGLCPWLWGGDGVSARTHPPDSVTAGLKMGALGRFISVLSPGGLGTRSIHWISRRGQECRQPPTSLTAQGHTLTA